MGLSSCGFAQIKSTAVADKKRFDRSLPHAADIFHMEHPQHVNNVADLSQNFTADFNRGEICRKICMKLQIHHRFALR